MSTARHHTEWLSLLEISGPFVSLPVLMRAFPQGLDAADPALAHDLRVAYDEWLDNQSGTRPDPAIHRAWIEWVLRNVLEMPAELVRGLEIAGQPAEIGEGGPASLSVAVAEYGETLQPDLAVFEPAREGEGGAPLKARLLVQVLPWQQDPEKPLPGRQWKASPATRMMTLLHGTGVRLGMLTDGERWVLVDAPKDGTTGYTSWYAHLWLEEPLTLRALRSLLGARRFFGVPDEETIEALLAASADNQQEVTDQLGYQVRRAVELLVQAIDLADQDRGRTLLKGITEADLYEAAVTVMMRLVFLLSAEERGLLLLGDPIYDQHYAVSTLGAQLRETADQAGEEVLERRHDAWCRLLATFRAVCGGMRHDRLTLPALGSSLFDPDRFPFLEGRQAGSDWRRMLADPLPISNRTVLHLLEALQLLQVRLPGGGPAEARRLSFLALGIEQIGHVYEGLLDHTARRAATPVLGLTGTRDREPEIALPELEAELAKGEKAFLAYLSKQTGRSASALRKAVNATPELEQAQRLRAACGNDAALYERVLPFAGLLREDNYGRLVVIPAGSVYVTAGQERRATGTHYTPRSLTEPIVQHTMEPLVYAGPAEGKPREEWRLRAPGEILDLKVCDMAMGSGAFLVQACRYLSERLLEAWEAAEKARSRARTRRLITAEGEPTDDANLAVPANTADREALAKLLIASRCLYGVDKNPLAVEMAKLSLWLVTLAKDRPLTFLDHALKCGDSLVGANQVQLQYWDLQAVPDGKPRFEPFGTGLDLQRLIELRCEVQALPERDLRDQQVKAHKLAEAEALAHDLKAGADMLIASYFSDLKVAETERLREGLWRAFRQGADVPAGTPDLATVVPGGVRPFHWKLEFPEVFLAPAVGARCSRSEGGGFDAILGNPPFIGGKRIRETLGDGYRRILYDLYAGSAGGADYCAFFFLRAFAHLRCNGTLGLLATNTIAQGDTRRTGLHTIVENGGLIYRATNDQPWPGQAAVAIDVVHIRKGDASPPYVLDSRPVRHISTLLDSRKASGNPRPLLQNKARSFIGSFVNGMGFILTPEEAGTLITADPRNGDVLFPYLNGEDLNRSPDQSPSRWIINFFDWPLEKAETYPLPMTILRHKVYPVRAKVNRKAHHKYWWHYGDKRPALYRAIASLRRVLVLAITSKHLSLSFVSSEWVYSHACAIVVSDDAADFAVLQSTMHEAWARMTASTLETRLRYTPADVFETFPFVVPTPVQRSALCTKGETYHEFRRQVMLARREGLTIIYNRFHNPEEVAHDIAELRALHMEMDQAVAAAYGWDDLDLGHGFHETPQGLRYTISPAARDEVLDRLLALNHERYEEEVRQGLHDKKGRKGLRESKGQYNLL